MKDKENTTNKEENLKLITEALENQMMKDLADKIDLYDKKFIEIFENLTEIQELLLLSVEENKKASINLSQIEIDAKIAEALQEFNISEENSSYNKNYSIYILIGLIFLGVGYFLK